MLIRTSLALALAGATAFAAPAARRTAADPIEQKLRGLVAGKPQSCVNPSPSGYETHSGNTFLIKDRGGTLYRSQFQASCEAPESDALITRRFGSNLCRGDIAEVRDLQSGFTRTSCTFSDFVPYRRP